MLISAPVRATSHQSLVEDLFMRLSFFGLDDDARQSVKTAVLIVLGDLMANLP